MKEKKILNSKMREIITAIHKNGGAMSENEIAEKTGLSYVTVKKYMNKMVKIGIIKEIK